MTDEQVYTAMQSAGAVLPDENKKALGPIDKAAIEDKVGFGIAVMNMRRRTEPYLQNGMIYTSNDNHHIFAYYRIPPGTEDNEVISPVFTVLGEDMDDCLRETSRSLREFGEERISWEIFPVDSNDLGKIINALGKDICRRGLLLSVHRTPVTYIAEHYQPEPERTDRKKDLEELKQHILKQWPPIKGQSQ